MPEPSASAVVARNAVAALRGYAYQTLAAALAWLDIPEHSKLCLEVTEDYAIVARDAIEAVQVKDTAGSGSVTLHSESVRNAIDRFVARQAATPSRRTYLRFFTTSEIGTERPPTDLPAGEKGLRYWRRCAVDADVLPIRNILEGPYYSTEVRTFCAGREDLELRRDLLQRIHWDCGRPDFAELRKELESRLIVLGRETFQLPSREVSRLADSLLCSVLQTSILKNTEERVLTRAALFRTIDDATMVLVPRTRVVGLVEPVSSVGAAMTSVLAGSDDFPGVDSHWIVDICTFPIPQGVIGRPDLESSVNAALAIHGVCLLVGSSGVGKSTLARSVVPRDTERAHTIEFRNLRAEEARRRLDALLGHIGHLQPGAVILEDLNVLYEARVAVSAGRVVEALRRRDVRVIVTCHRRPSQASLGNMGIWSQCVVPCAYFSPNECALLVQKYGGDGDTWGRIAHRAGSGGHPQLVHAFVSGIAARGWPPPSGDDPGTGVSTSSDVDAVREDARRVIAGLPHHARTLLYRLSLGLVHFTRSTALAIGALPPVVPRCGEGLDELVGPWVERTNGDLFRVSPLVSQIGREMLAGTSAMSAHRAFALETLKGQRLIVSDMNGIFSHAMMSKTEQGLAQLAISVMTAEGSTVALLAENFGKLREASLREPIYPESSKTSAILRLAQMKLLAEASGQADMTEVVAAVFAEIKAVSEESLRDALEAFALGNIVVRDDVVNRVDNWVALLIRAEQAAKRNLMFGILSAGIQKIADLEGASAVTLLWNIGIGNVASVERLDRILEDLDSVDESLRSVWLIPLDEALADYSVWIGGAWSSEEARGDLNPEDAALRYKRMAARTLPWKESALSSQCSVAEAVLRDQYMEDKEAALSVLAEAEVAAGEDPIVLRGRAGIYYRHQEYETALCLFRRIVGRIDDGNPVEHAFALREAAISAAQCEQWEEAESWFLQAQSGARRVGSRDMDVMATALEADLAAVALLAGNTRDAIRRFAQALKDSESVSGQGTLVWGYCQRVVRHAVLWCFNRIEGKDLKGASGEAIVFEPGMCSNPSPMKEILKHPLAPLDTVWYMLAQAEVTSGVDTCILEKLDDVLRAGRIPALDAAVRWRKMGRNIGRLDADSFARDLMAFLEGEKYVRENHERLMARWNAMEPERGEIPALDADAPGGASVESTARSSILSFAMHALCARQPEAIDALERALTETCGEKWPVGQAMEELRSGHSQGSAREKAVVEAIVVVRRKRHMGTEFFWGVCFHFFRWADTSDFKEILTAGFAAWLRGEWTQIVEEQAFSLVSPTSTIPCIREVLKVRRNSREFVLRMLTVTLDASLHKGRWAYRREIETMWDE